MVWVRRERSEGRALGWGTDHSALASLARLLLLSPLSKLCSLCTKMFNTENRNATTACSTSFKAPPEPDSLPSLPSLPPQTFNPITPSKTLSSFPNGEGVLTNSTATVHGSPRTSSILPNPSSK